MSTVSNTILFLDTVHPMMAEILSQKGFRCLGCQEMDLGEIQALLPEALGLVIRSRFTLDEQFLAKADKLRWIARSGIGLENIDLDYCAAQGINAFNAAGGNADAVGEHVIGMLLSQLNHIHTGDHAVRQGVWDREAHRGRELGARTVGIIGYGHTGQSLARKLSGFGCTVVAYDKYAPVNPSYAKAVSLKKLQSQADIISFHVPLTEETHHYLDRQFVDDMAQSFHLVNASRGPVCSTAAIAQGIAQGKIIGACLDVLEEERKDFEIGAASPALSSLLGSERVLFSPHVAGWTSESYTKLAQVLLKRILEQA